MKYNNQKNKKNKKHRLILKKLLYNIWLNIICLLQRKINILLQEICHLSIKNNSFISTNKLLKELINKMVHYTMLMILLILLQYKKIKLLMKNYLTLHFMVKLEDWLHGLNFGDICVRTEKNLEIVNGWFLNLEFYKNKLS